MSHPCVTDMDHRTAENDDVVLTFGFDIDVLVGAEMVEFDRQQFLDGEPSEKVYRGLYPDLAELIKLHFNYPNVNPCRHITVTSRQVVVTYDPSRTWDLDIDPVSFFTWHYERICDGKTIEEAEATD